MVSLRDDRPNASPDIVDSGLAVACVLPPIDRAGRRVSVQDLLQHATRWTECEDGMLMEFPGGDETARALFEFVLAERRCCPHFTYELGFAPDHQRVTVRLRAAGAKLAALKAIYGGLVSAARERAGA
jgi:hypothetical protein